MCKENHMSIMKMPVKRFYDLLKWKGDLEDERAKMMEERRGK